MSNRPTKQPAKTLEGTSATPRAGGAIPAAPRSSRIDGPGSASAGSSAPRSKRTGWLIGGIVAIVVAAAVIAIASSSSDDEEAATTPVSGAPCPAATGAGAGSAAVPDGGGESEGDGGIAEYRPVQVAGTPLPPGTDGAVCSQVPVLTGQSFDGTPITVGAPGKATLVAFVAHWCPHCQREVPRLVEWASSGAVPADVDVVGVATATTDARDNYPPSEWLEGEGWPWPVLVDDDQSTAATAYGVSGFPFFALYDADGKLVLRTSGELDTAGLAGMITDALGR